MSDKCPRCGSLKRTGTRLYDCGSPVQPDVLRRPDTSKDCLRRQLAAANAKIAEMARLAEDSAKAADEMKADLAELAALKAEKAEAAEAWKRWFEVWSITAIDRDMDVDTLNCYFGGGVKIMTGDRICPCCGQWIQPQQWARVNEYVCGRSSVYPLTVGHEVSPLMVGQEVAPLTVGVAIPLDQWRRLVELGMKPMLTEKESDEAQAIIAAVEVPDAE